jgi:hypothetical protein
MVSGPDRRQQQRQPAEECGECGEHALARHGLIYLRRQRVDFDRDLAVYGGDNALDGLPQSALRQCDTDFEALGLVF